MSWSKNVLPYHPFVKSNKHSIPISLNIHLESLDLLRKCILSNSLARYFYCEERHKIVKTLSGRVAKFCTKYDININKYVEVYWLMIMILMVILF